MATENWRAEFPWEVRKRAAVVCGELAAYAAEFVLQCSRVTAGGAVSASTHTFLPSMCQRYLKLRPKSEPDLLSLVSAHRTVFHELLNHRSGQRDGRLRLAREQHSQALRRLFEGLQKLG